MKLVLYLIAIALLFSSCASIFSRRSYTVAVSSNVPSAHAEILDSVYILPAKIKVKRSKEDLLIKVTNDTIVRDFIVKSVPSKIFLYGNLIWVEAAPIAYLIDLTNPKRFYYGKNIYLNLDDTASIIKPRSLELYRYFTKEFPTEKGQLYLTLSAPHVNTFYLQPIEESIKSNTGFWGVSAGLEYYYKKSKYLSFTGNAVMDFFVPIPVAVDMSGEYEIMSSTYLSLTDNVKFNRFTLGYGLSFARNTWSWKYDPSFDPGPPTRDPVKKSSNALGFHCDGYFQFSKVFFAGLIYRPTLLTVSPETTYKYEHLISLDFEWKIRLKKDK